MTSRKITLRLKRKKSIRKKLSGSAAQPRVTVFKSAKHIYAQVINDDEGKVLVACQTLGKANAPTFENLCKVDAAKKLGELVSAECKDKGIGKVVFDRNGYRYHGRIKAFAESLRSEGVLN